MVVANKLTPEELAEIKKAIPIAYYPLISSLLHHIDALQAELTAKDEDGKRLVEALDEIGNPGEEEFQEASDCRWTARAALTQAPQDWRA